jgi:hypothetical protein
MRSSDISVLRLFWNQLQLNSQSFIAQRAYLAHKTKDKPFLYKRLPLASDAFSRRLQGQPM